MDGLEQVRVRHDSIDQSPMDVPRVVRALARLIIRRHKCSYSPHVEDGYEFKLVICVPGVEVPHVFDVDGQAIEVENGLESVDEEGTRIDLRAAYVGVGENEGSIMIPDGLSAIYCGLSPFCLQVMRRGLQVKPGHEHELELLGNFELIMHCVTLGAKHDWDFVLSPKSGLARGITPCYIDDHDTIMLVARTGSLREKLIKLATKVTNYDTP